MPDYNKQYSDSSPKRAPKHDEHNRYGGKANPFGTKGSKADLLARMAENAKRNKETTEK